MVFCAGPKSNPVSNTFISVLLTNLLLKLSSITETNLIASYLRCSTYTSFGIFNTAASHKCLMPPNHMNPWQIFKIACNPYVCCF